MTTNNSFAVMKARTNLAPEAQQLVAQSIDMFTSTTRSTGFARSTEMRINATELFVHPQAEDPKKTEARGVFEIVVDEEMVNMSGNMHGGCAAYLIDICSSLTINVLAAARGSIFPHVTLALNTTYHAPAPLGVNLKIINTTLAMGGRSMSVRSEIWDTTNHRLVASGVHIKMRPSEAKL